MSHMKDEIKNIAILQLYHIYFSNLYYPKIKMNTNLDIIHIILHFLNNTFLCSTYILLNIFTFI